MLQLNIGGILRSYRKRIPWIRVRPWTWVTLQSKKRRISRSYPQPIPWIRVRPWTWLMLQLQIRRTLYIRVTWVKLRVSCYRLTLSLKKRIHPSLWTDYDPGFDWTRPWTWLNLSQTQGQVLVMLTHIYTRETKLSCNAFCELHFFFNWLKGRMHRGSKWCVLAAAACCEYLCFIQ